LISRLQGERSTTMLTGRISIYRLVRVAGIEPARHYDLRF